MDISIILKENLNDLLIEHNIKAKNLADALGVGNATIARYLNNGRIPTIEYLVKIADYFNCTTDYLLGMEDEIKKKEFLPCPPFAERLDYLLKFFKFSPSQIYTNTGISKARYYEWKNKDSQPKLENVVKLANLFGCSVDFVIGRSKI